MEEYSIFLNDKDILSKLNVNKLNLKQINERFILLSKPVNTYCNKNFINIQGIIDQIIKTAQPYFKDKTFNAKHKININNDNKKLLDFNESFNYNEINFDEIRDLGYEKPYYIDDLDENNSSNMNWTIPDLDDLNWLRFKDFQNN